MGRVIGVTVFALVVAAAAIFFYQMRQEGAEERRLRAELSRLTLETRVARIYVKSIEREEPPGSVRTTLKWQESGPNGAPLPIRTLAIAGDQVYVDTLQIVFDTDKAREGDPLRGHALNLFYRIYSAEVAPKDGIRLDVPDGSGASGAAIVPRFFRSGEQARELETTLWSEFWELTRNEALAKKRGVRTAQGKAVWKPLEAGKEYRITLTPTGQLTFEGPFEPDPLLVNP